MNDLSPEVMALAEERAAGDRALLERLVREGKVVRVPESTRRVRRERVNATIIPRAKRRRRR